MEKQLLNVVSTLTMELPTERERIVRLCTTLTGDRDIAEDLAQETMLEAWRHIHTLRDHEKRIQWLNGIARNVYLRWARKHGQDLAQREFLHPEEHETSLEERLVDDYDIEIELERKELVSLLDKAMSLLPEETRTVLIKRYIEEAPIADVAAQMGTNTGAVAMRLQRGKLALRRLLDTELQPEGTLYGIAPVRTEDWQETSIWCWLCGEHRLRAIFEPSRGFFQLKCPQCSPRDDEFVTSANIPALLKDVKSYKPALNRLFKWCDQFYKAALNNGFVICSRCGRSVETKIRQPDNAPDWLLKRAQRAIDVQCPDCRLPHWESIEGMTLSLPQAQPFIKRYPRIRALPEQIVEAHGRRAIVISFESITDNARFTMISDHATYKVLDIYGGNL